MSATPQHTLAVFEPDPVIEAYKQHIDRTWSRENLKLTVENRFRKLHEHQGFAVQFRRAGRLARS